MAENRSSLINAGPQLNAGLEKTPGQNCRILNKRWGCLIEKIRTKLIFDTASYKFDHL